mgnify:CR=1 FL=1
MLALQNLKLAKLPPEIAQVAARLTTLSLSHNLFKECPAQLGACQQNNGRNGGKEPNMTCGATKVAVWNVDQKEKASKNEGERNEKKIIKNDEK